MFGPNQCIQVTSSRYARVNVILETVLAFLVDNAFPQGDLLSEFVESFPESDCTGTAGESSVSVAVMCNSFIDGFPDPPAIVVRGHTDDVILDYRADLSTPDRATYQGAGYRVDFAIKP